MKPERSRVVFCIMKKNAIITKTWLREQGACYTDDRLDEVFGKRKAVTPLQVAQADNVPLDDKLWVLTRVLAHLDENAARMYAIESALTVAHLAGDEDDQALYLGLMNDLVQIEEELEYAARDAARGAAWDAAWDAARDAARDVVWGVVWDVVRDAVWGAARDAAWGAARDAAWGAARDAARGAAWGAAWDAAQGAAWDAAQGAALQKAIDRALEWLGDRAG